MTITPGTRLGRYEIVSRIGAGGMGEVFKARDTQLERSVAIKVLPASVAADAQRNARFEREAKAISQLNHPHICTLHDVGRDNGTSYVVMELLEGETLAERIARGPMPLPDVLRYGEQIADALDRAHRAQIVHRDLKPANVMLTRSGAKLLDFGLARSTQSVALAHDAPTMQQEPLTSEGLIVGTLPYMSPEQLHGNAAVDARTDVFAFGAVLYEMITGRRAFSASSGASLIAEILEHDPPRPSLTRVTAPALEHVVMTCLAKEPDARFQCMADVAHELRWIASGIRDGAPVVAAATTERRWLLPVAATLALLIGAAAATFVARRTKPSAAPPMTFAQLTFDTGEERQPAISPDGKMFAFVRDTNGQSDIFLQRVDGRSAINLTPDSPFNDHEPAFSPDGNQIAFRSERDGGGIYVMGATGESVRRLTTFGFDPAWSSDGKEIVFAAQETVDPASVYGVKKIHIVDAASGAVRLFLDATDVLQPNWSPHGHRVAYWRAGDGGRRDIYTIDRSGRAESIVPVTADTAIDWNPVWSPDGRYLYFLSDRDGTMNLWRAAVDEQSGKRTGELEPLRTPADYAAFLSLTRGGDQLLYQSISRTTELLPIRIDPAAMRVTAPARPAFSGATRFRNAVPSPDGKSIVFTTIGTQEDLFVMNVDGTGLRQLTNDAFRDRGASWWPDGSRVIFYSNRGGAKYDAWTIRPDGAGLTRISTIAAGVNFPLVSRDGKRAGYIADNGSGFRISEVDANGQMAVGELIAQLPENGFRAVSWSPDGKWLAGASWRATGDARIYIYSVEARQMSVLPLRALAAAFVDDDHLVVVDEQHRVALTDRAGRQVRVISDARIDVESGGFRGISFSFSQDGRTLVATRQRVESDIWKGTLSNPQ